MNTYHSLAKVVTVLAAIISLIVFIAIPSIYFSVAYRYELEELQVEADHSASAIDEIIFDHPDTWRLDKHRLTVALLGNASRIYRHRNQIRDEQGNSIAFIPVELDWPVFDRSAELVYKNKIVGTIKIEESLRPLLFETGVVALGSAMLALAIYFVLKIFPLRALTRVVRRLDESNDLLRVEMLAKEQALQEAQNIGSAMRHQAMHDGLTNLPNRILLHDRLQQALSIGNREKKMLALIMMDMDQFKGINDALGHHAGDRVLQEVALRLQRVLRDSDTIARLGGDEFAILLSAVNGQSGGLIAAHKILETIRQPLKIDNHVLHIGASLGIVLFPEHGNDPAMLLRCADVAMYKAKCTKTGFAIYDSQQDMQDSKRTFLQNDLLAAIEENQLILHYQPKIDLASNRICGVEALVRWQHPKEGLVFPDAFIPIAEQNGLIKPLTRSVLQMALQQSTVWLHQGLELPIAINISAINLMDPYFPDQVVEIMSKFSVSPALIEMEITETALMQHPLHAIGTVKKLCDIGIILSIDDFGIGYSSMAYLKKLVVAKIKIDKSFVLDMIKNENDDTIVRSIIDLAHNLGLTVVAEGVESAEALERLKTLGCDIAQGCHMGLPVSAAKLNEWLEKSSWSCVKDDVTAEQF